ncbi:hypothetical protein D3C79_549110 [compost metagenome]
MPQRRLEDIIQCRRNPIVRNILFTNETQDSGIESCNMLLPIRQGTFAIFKALICDFGESPRHGVIRDIVDKLIQVTINFGTHSR